MIDFVRTWRFFPKLLAGVGIAVLLCILGCGTDVTHCKLFLMAAVKWATDLDIMGFTLVVGASILFFVLANIGLLVGELLLATITTLGRTVVPTRLSRAISRSRLFRELFTAPWDLALLMLRERSELVMDIAALKNDADNLLGIDHQKLDAYQKRVRTFWNALESVDIPATWAYLSNYTQEQRHMDELREDVKLIHLLYITLVLACVVLLRYSNTLLQAAPFVALMLLMMLAFAPVLRARKRTEALHLLYYLVDIFAVRELGDNADRDVPPVL